MGAGGSVAYESEEAALADGRSELEVKGYVAAQKYVEAFNSKDAAKVGGLLATTGEDLSSAKPPVWLGNTSTGPPRPMKNELILGLLQGFMFDCFGFEIVDPKISADGPRQGRAWVLQVYFNLSVLRWNVSERASTFRDPEER